MLILKVLGLCILQLLLFSILSFEHLLYKVFCFYLDGTVNLYMRPIEGITLTVDLDQMEIIGYQDRAIVPVPKSDGTDYRESEMKPPFRPSLKEITVVQPDGPSFTVDGHIIRYVVNHQFQIVYQN